MRHEVKIKGKYEIDGFYYIISEDGHIPKKAILFPSFESAYDYFDDFIYDEDIDDEEDNAFPHQILKCDFQPQKTYSPREDTKEVFTYFLSKQPLEDYGHILLKYKENRLDPFYAAQMLKFGTVFNKESLLGSNWDVSYMFSDLIFKFLKENNELYDCFLSYSYDNEKHYHVIGSKNIEVLESTKLFIYEN